MIIRHNKQSKTLHIIHQVLKRQYQRSGKTLLQKEMEKENKRTFTSKKSTKRIIQNRNVYELVSTSKIHIIYLHGGAYLLDGNTLHDKFIRLVHKKMNASIHYIDYPLSSEGNYKNTISVTSSVLNELFSEYPEDSFYVIGDSAGAGLALSLSEYISRDFQGYFLLSPWLDISMKHKDIDLYNHKDPFFTKEELVDCATRYSDNLEDPDCSPLYGNYQDKHIIVFTGTADLCHFDALLWEKHQPHIILHIYQDAPHVFALLPNTKEQKEVIQLIAETINQKQ